MFMEFMDILVGIFWLILAVAVIAYLVALILS